MALDSSTSCQPRLASKGNQPEAQFCLIFALQEYATAAHGFGTGRAVVEGLLENSKDSSSQRLEGHLR